MGNFGKQDHPQPHPDRLNNPEIHNQRDMAAAVFDRYDTNNPIAIVPVKNKPGTYVVLLSGTEPANFSQATTLPEDCTACINQDDRYRRSVMNALDEAGIKKTDKLIFAGHSLGGMEAQNIVADKNFQSRYTASEVITFGSPKTAPEQPGVQYHRYATVGDPVVKASFGSLSGLDAGKQQEVSDNRLRDLEKVNAGKIDMMRHPYQSMLNPGGAVGVASVRDLSAGIDQHMSYPKVRALEQYQVNGREGLSLDREHMRTFGARRDPLEEDIQRKERQISAKITEVYENQQRAGQAPPVADPKAAERRAMAEQMRERSGRSGPSESQEQTHQIRR